jgi:hypothetical protein
MAKDMLKAQSSGSFKRLASILVLALGWNASLTLRQGNRVGHMQTFAFDVFHTFPLTRKELLCAEQLWMSDSTHPNHYRKTHSRNKGMAIS